jgi:hypothetical protein
MLLYLFLYLRERFYSFPTAITVHEAYLHTLVQCTFSSVLTESVNDGGLRIARATDIMRATMAFFVAHQQSLLYDQTISTFGASLVSKNAVPMISTLWVKLNPILSPSMQLRTDGLRIVTPAVLFRAIGKVRTSVRQRFNIVDASEANLEVLDGVAQRFYNILQQFTTASNTTPSSPDEANAWSTVFDLISPPSIDQVVYGMSSMLLPWGIVWAMQHLPSVKNLIPMIRRLFTTDWIVQVWHDAKSAVRSPEHALQEIQRFVAERLSERLQQLWAILEDACVAQPISMLLMAGALYFHWDTHAGALALSNLSLNEVKECFKYVLVGGNMLMACESMVRMIVEMLRHSIHV